MVIKPMIIFASFLIQCHFSIVKRVQVLIPFMIYIWGLGKNKKLRRILLRYFILLPGMCECIYLSTVANFQPFSICALKKCVLFLVQTFGMLGNVQVEWYKLTTWPDTHGSLSPCSHLHLESHFYKRHSNLGTKWEVWFPKMQLLHQKLFLFGAM